MNSKRQKIEKIFANLQELRNQLPGERGSHLEKSGLSMTQGFVLMMVARSIVKTISDIAAKLSVTKSAATQIVNGLEDRGFVQRVADQSDRRVTQVLLTDDGKDYIKKFKQEGIKQFTAVFECLDDDDLIALEKITKKLIDRGQTSAETR